MLDVVIVGDVPKLTIPALAPDRVQGRARRASPTSRCCAPREVEISADRPFTMYADGDPIAELPVDRPRAAGCRPRDRAAMTVLSMQDRGRPGGRRAGAPRRPRRRHQPAGQGADAPRAARDRRAGRAAAARLGGDLGHQRQDDHGRDGGLDPRARRHLAGSQPRRSEHGRRRGLDAARQPPAGVQGSTGEHGAVRGRRVLARPGRRHELDPRAVLLCNLFRDQLDRYGELETIADRWADGRRRRCPAGAGWR